MRYVLGQSKAVAVCITVREAIRPLEQVQSNNRNARSESRINVSRIDPITCAYRRFRE